MIKNIKLLLAFFALSTVMIAQTANSKVAGTVTDNDGNPLVGANVLLEGSGLGAATDGLGRYFILDVPVGTYTVRAEYIGYKTYLESNVKTSVGFTTTVDFDMDVASVAGEEVTVVRDRKLINTNATNTTRVVSKELIDNFAVRGVSNIVNLQAGVVNGFFRGSRSADNKYFIDGVPVKDLFGGGNFTGQVNQEALQEVSVQAGGASAEYGGANGGVINLTTRAGGSKWSFGVNYLTSVGDTGYSTKKDKLYSDGYENVTFDFGGPISDNLKMYLSVQNTKFLGSLSSGYRVKGQVQECATAEECAAIENVLWVQEVIRNNNDTNVQASSLTPDLNTTTYLGYSDYQRVYGAQTHDDSETNRYVGNLTYSLGQLKLKLGFQGSEGFNKGSSNSSQVYNENIMGSGSYNDTSFNLAYLNANYAISPLSFVKLTVSSQAYETESYNERHGNVLGDYGLRSTDTSDPYYYWRRNGYGNQSAQLGGLIGQTSYGYQYSSYYLRNTDTNTISIDYLNQVGFNELKMGASIENHEISYYSDPNPERRTYQFRLLDTDGDGSISGNEYADANANPADWNFSVLKDSYVSNLGYDIYGNKWDGSYNEASHMIAPGEPKQKRFYIQNKFELKDVVVQLGLAYESFDSGAMAPDSDGDGVGDSDGYDQLYFRNLRLNRSGDENGDYAWEKVAVETDLQPRIGIAFPISDRSVFRANYSRYWQPVTLSNLYVSDTSITSNFLAGNFTTTGNAALKPERSTQYEVGVEQMIGENAAVKLEGFYKESKDYLFLEGRNDAQISTLGTESLSQFQWTQYKNGDFLVSQGVTASIEMRRVEGWLAQVNYTVSEARGTGSTGSSNYYVSYLEGEYPKTLSLVSYDQRHTGNAILDYRSMAQTGFMKDAGMNMVIKYGSGTRYTPMQLASQVFGNTRPSKPDGPLNSVVGPSYFNIDLRLDKTISMGRGSKVNLYVNVYNLLNTEQELAHWSTSGMVDDDGWIGTESGQAWVSNWLGQFPDVPAEDLYRDMIGGSGRFGAPRTVRVGLNYNF
ncbi:TonB-dependent receptor [Candidatus Marinimicrobia bacterium]|jgi:outer membrane receptor protein involved in Fe transport|nr:TonB-dependent receptor [Candidatus Neomarinimicrobiota bacterium]